MWEYEHSIETSAAPEAIWRLWSDVEGWSSWNADIEKIEIDGPFAPGSVISMTPGGQDTVRLRLAEVEREELFVDEAELGDVLVRTEHRLEPVDSGRVRVTYRMQITGPSANAVGPEIGPAITADFPETMAALVELAAR
jgi:uncharacterized protein YndB with AHSA1/START domain